MSVIDEIRDQDHMRTRLRRAGRLVLYEVVILVALYLFARRWSAFALLVPAVAVVVVVVFTMRIMRVLRFRHGERRHRDRRHTDRREQDDGEGALEPVRDPARDPVRESPPTATRRTG